MSEITSVEVRRVRLPLVTPFKTSFGTETERVALLVAVSDGEHTGWGEGVAMSGGADGGEWAFYSYETLASMWEMITGYLAPAVLGRDLEPAEVADLGGGLRGHQMARAAMEAAVWDLRGRVSGHSVATMLADERGSRASVPVGVSLGIQPTIPETLAAVGRSVDRGYGRVKLKIEPGWDIDPVAAVRDAYPDLALSVDANAAYTLADSDIFAEMDKLDLLMIEQPLAYDDYLDHSRLQAQLETDLCLDESIRSVRDVELALELDSCRIINIKPGRVGGLTESVKIHDLCESRGVPVWCGGMLETGVGRAGNLALASLPGFTLPGDISESARYWHRDVLTEPFVLNDDGTMDVPSGPGLGRDIDDEFVDHLTEQRFVASDS